MIVTGRSECDGRTGELPSSGRGTCPSGTGRPCSPPARGGLLVLAASFLLAAGAVRSAAADVYVGFSPPTLSVAAGDTFTVNLVITQADAPFNAFDASMLFDPSMLAFVPAASVSNQRGSLITSACSNTFHKFNAAPDSLRISLSLLCSNTSVTGPGQLYTVQFVAGSVPGTTTITLGPFTEFYNAGIFVRPLHPDSMTIAITPSTSGVTPGRGGEERLELLPPEPNPGQSGGPLRLEFSLPARDHVGFDLLDVLGRRIAQRDTGWWEGGRHAIVWSPSGLGSGAYFVRLRTGSGGSAVQRWCVLR